MTIGRHPPNYSANSVTATGVSRSIPHEASTGEEISSISNSVVEDKENVASSAGLGNEATQSPRSVRLQKLLKIDVHSEPTLTETFSISSDAAWNPAQNDSLFITSTADCEESRLEESRSCSLNDDRADEDDERDDAMPNQNSEPFLQTRVEYTEPFIKKERAFVFLMSSSESWNCDAARETSLFDDDELEEEDGRSLELGDRDNEGHEEIQANEAPPPFVKNHSTNFVYISPSQSDTTTTGRRLCGEHTAESLVSVISALLRLIDI